MVAEAWANGASDALKSEVPVQASSAAATSDFRYFPGLPGGDNSVAGRATQAPSQPGLAMGVFANLLLRKHSALASAVFSTSLLSGFLFTAATGHHASSLVTGQSSGALLAGFH